MKTKRFSRVLALVTLLSLLVQMTAVAQDTGEPGPADGTLVVLLLAEDGTPLDGCVTVSDANGGVSTLCADDGSGMVTFTGLPVGNATVTNTATQDGYYQAGAVDVVILEDAVPTATLYSTPVPVPTEEPTEIPTEAPTVAPTEEPAPEPTDEPTQEPTQAPAKSTTSREPDVSLLAVGNPSISCVPLGPNLGADITLYLPSPDGELDTAPTVTYYEIDRFGNETHGQGVMVWDAASGEYRYVFALPDNPSAEVNFEITVEGEPTPLRVAADCALFNPLVLAIDTVATDGTNSLADGAQIESGTPFGDTATFIGPDVQYANELAGQTVTYRLYKDDATCGGTPVAEFDVVVNADGTIPNTPMFTPADDGIYDWHVVYAGDANFAAATSICGSETVVVGQNTTSVTTSMKRADGSTIGQGATVPIGTTVYDTATLNGANGTASGNVTYTLVRGTCGGGAETVFGPETVTMANGQIPASPEYTPDALGTYHWIVEYEGDAQNAAATSPCGDETFVVGPAQPSIDTVMFQADGTPIEQGGEVARGTEVYDTASMTGFYIPDGGSLTGDVTYTLYRGACPGGEVVGSVTVPAGGDASIPDSDAFVADTAGTYNWVVRYAGDDYNAPAVSDCGSETFNVTLNPTTIATKPELQTGDDAFSPIDTNDVVGSPADVRDTAVVGGLTGGATGTVTYTLYKGSGCGGDAFAGPFTVDLNADGSVPASPVVEGLEPGQYNWVASYSGDANNDTATGECGDEQFFVADGPGPAGYVRTDVVNDANGSVIPDDAHVPLGTSVHDTAQFYGTIVDDEGNATVGGRLVYSLYAGTTCDSDAVDSWSVTVTAGQPVPDMPESYTFINAGTFNFQAVFTPDGGSAISSPCGTETVIVDPVRPTLTTTIYADDVEVAPQTRLTRPVSVADGVTFSYGSQNLDGVAGPNGTLTYALYNNAGCSGEAVFTDTKPVVNGVYDRSDAFGLTDENHGVYNWVVTFTPAEGETNYLAAKSGCGSETFYLDAQPELTTTMFSSENGEGEGTELLTGGTLTVGDFIRDTGTLANIAPGASGTVTFTLHQGGTCEGTAMFSNTVNVADGVVESTGWYKIRLAGQYSWSAHYSGNNANGGFNNPADSDCSTETFIVEPAPADATMETVMRNGDTVIPHLNYIARPASVTDEAVFTNLSDDASGTVTYQLYASADCADGTLVHTSEKTVANGIAPLSDPYTIPAVGNLNGQVFSWVVTFEGMDRDAPVSLTSGCGDEQFRIYESFAYTATAVCTYNVDDNTMSFTVTLNPRPVGDTGPGVTITMQPYNLDLSPVDPITLNDEWVFTYDQKSWRRVDGQVQWSNGSRASFSVRCLQSPYDPEFTTTMYQGDSVLENDTMVAPGTAVSDTTQVTPGTSTIIMSGTLTYQLLRGDTCDTATPYAPAQSRTLNETPIGELPGADPVTVNDPGTYWWVVTYTPPSTPRVPDNNAATSPCGAEFFSVEAFDTALTTLIVTENGSSTAAATGEDVHDTARMTRTSTVPTSLTPTGTVTYYAYAGNGADACTGDPVFTSGPLALNADGSFPPSETTRFLTPGDYEFQAAYSGDANFNASTSACGTEPLRITAPALTITKVADAATVNAGDQIGFTITVTNPGPGVATDVVLTDTLPVVDGVEWSIDTANSAESCAIVEGVLTCDNDELAAGASLSAHIVGTTSGETCGEITNAAEFTSGNSNDGDDEATVTVLCPDVTILKTAAQGTVNATDDIVFNLEIRNIGAGVAYGVVVTDELPAGLTWTIDGGTAAEACAIEEGVLTCDPGTMEPGAVATVAVRATTSYETCGAYPNTAEVSATNEKSTATENNSSTATATVNCSDIAVTKIADDAEVSAGDQIGFTISVTNNGDGAAYGVVLTDQLPVAEGLAWTIDPDVEGCAIEEGVLTCDVGDMAPGDNASVRIVSPTTADTCGVIDNNALITSDNQPDVPTSGQTVVKCPNVVVQKTAGSAFISAGEAISFDITVSNPGGGIARNVVVTDTLPEGFDWTIEPANESCAIEDGVLTCELGDMAPEASVTVTVTAPTNAEQCGMVENTVNAGADNENPGDDNESGATVTIQCPDTSILKTTDTPTVSAGEEIGFTIAFTNAGPGKALDVVITDELPVTAGLDWRLDPANDACDIEDGLLDCEIGTVEAGETVTLTLVSPTTAESCGEIENTVNATVSNDDPSTSGSTVTVRCPDLEIVKTADADAVSAGEAIGFTITVTNRGEGASFDTVVSDTLPVAEGLAWAIDPEVDGCTIENGVLECDFGTIEPGASVSVHLTSVTTGQTCATVENTAEVSASNEPESARENNRSSASVTVRCSGIVFTKTADAESVKAGEQIGFTISLTNNGEGAAFDAVVTDTLPAVPGLAWTIDGGSGAEMCVIRDGVLECDFGTVEAGATVDVHIVSPTTVEGCQIVENTASVTFSNAEGVEAADETTVVCPDPDPATPTPTDPATPDPAGTPVPADPVTKLPSTGNGGSMLTTTGLAMLLLAAMAAVMAAVATWMRREGTR